MTHISYRNEWIRLSGTDDPEEDDHVSWERQTLKRMKRPHTKSHSNQSKPAQQHNHKLKYQVYNEQKTKAKNRTNTEHTITQPSHGTDTHTNKQKEKHTCHYHTETAEVARAQHLQKSKKNNVVKWQKKH